MRAVPVDERTGGFEVDFPDYRVYFFERTGERMPEGGTYPTAVYSYLLTEVHNVHQALAWADANARGRRHIVYAVVERGDVPGLLQLSGDDPNRRDDPHRAPPGELSA